MIFGTFVELSIIQFLTRKSRPQTTRTILQVDDLILLEHAINFLNGPMIFVKIMRFTNHDLISETLGNMAFSTVWKVVGLFITLHRAIGGAGIAIVRVICIRFHNIVLRFGAMRLVQFTCALTFSLCLVLAIGITVEMALVAPEIILNTFRNHKPVPNEYLSTSISCRIGTSCCLIFNVIELICYVIIFVEMYKQHKRHVKLCLSNKPKLAQKKKRRNAVTAVGHFTSWTVEMFLFGFLQYIIVAHRTTSTFAAWACFIWGLFAPSINYVVFPSVQAMTSEDLRRHVFSVDRCKEVFSAFYLKFKSEESNADVQPQGIELHVMVNGHAQIIT